MRCPNNPEKECYCRWVCNNIERIRLCLNCSKFHKESEECIFIK